MQLLGGGGGGGGGGKHQTVLGVVEDIGAGHTGMVCGDVDQLCKGSAGTMVAVCS